MSDCDYLATVAVDSISGAENFTKKKILSGLSPARFWSSVNAALPVMLKETPLKSWYDMLSEKINHMGRDHPIQPIFHFIAEDSDSTILASKCCHADNSASSKNPGLEMAVTRNVEYLLEAGYFSEGWSSSRSEDKYFRRGIRQDAD